jgi:molybdenum cofactor biosynthesis enzyme
MKEAAGEIEKQKIVPVSRDMIKEGNPLQNALAGAVDNAKKSFNL